VEVCIQMIARYTAAFGPVVHQLVQATNHSDTDPEHPNQTVLVRAKTRYRTTIVANTFAIIFPNADPNCRALLLGKELEGEGLFEIVFDVTTYRVVRFDIQFDFIPAFARVVPNPLVLSQLFSTALVATDCSIGEKGKPPLAPPVVVKPVEPPVMASPVREEVVEVVEPLAPSPTRSRIMDIRSLLN
jgi:hypothetical protein